MAVLGSARRGLFVNPEEIYKALYRIRRTEEECCRVYPTDRIQSPFHSSIGMELASVAVCSALKPGDAVFASYRSHAAFIAAGGDLKSFVAELYGKKTGCCRGKGGSMHLAHPGPTSSGLRFLGTSAIVASLIPVAVGFAWAQKLKKTGVVTVCFFGDGAAEEGCFFESLNFAALHELPILFVVENNGYAIHTPIAERQATGIGPRAAALGVLTIRAESFDDILGSASALATTVRDGGSPKLLEILSPRLKEHVGVGEDWHLGYRTADPNWKDPVRIVAERIPHGQQVRIADAVEREITEAFAFAEASPVPGPEELHQHLYAD